MKEQTKKEMQQKLADYRRPAPDIEWTELEKTLASNSKGTTVPIWVRPLAAAAVVLLVVGLGWQLMKEDVHAPEPYIGLVTAETMPAVAEQEPAVDEPTLTASSPKSAGAVDKFVAFDLPKQVEEMQDTVQGAIGQEVATEQNEFVAQETPGNGENVVEDTIPKRTMKTDVGSDTYELLAAADLPMRQTPELRHRLTATVYMANMFENMRISLGRGGEYESVYANVPSHNDCSQGDTIPPKQTKGAKKAKSTVSQEPVVEENVHHRRPIKFGVSVRYQLDKHWSIDAGLSYAYHSSDVTLRTKNFLFIAQQELSYMGIAVNGNYAIWSNRHFNIYESTGFAVEKMVRGKRSVEDLDYKEYVSIHPLQLSLACGIGAEFKLDRLFSIYAEPGIAYYIDNHSTIPTYYQDKPLNFNLNLGIRFNFGNR